LDATIINYLEQLWDIYKAELETQISAAAVGSNAWLQSKVMKFQYSASTPQVLAVDSNFAINYPTIDTTLQIITRCSVTTTSQRVCLVKVAKSDPPVALSAPELSSLSGFLSDFNFAGVNYVAQSLTSDKIYIDADIYYNGQYASTISANVITAINAYLAAIPFDGKIKLMSLIDAIQAVTGVTDVVLKNVAIRADATAFANKTYLVQNKTSIIPLYQMYAGYATEETTSGYTFTDTLVFIAQ